MCFASAATRARKIPGTNPDWGRDNENHDDGAIASHPLDPNSRDRSDRASAGRPSRAALAGHCTDHSLGCANHLHRDAGNLQDVVPEWHGRVEWRGAPGKQRNLSQSAKLQLLSVVDADVS